MIEKYANTVPTYHAAILLQLHYSNPYLNHDFGPLS